MPGSDHHQRTPEDQASWPEETATKPDFVQVAIVYRGTEGSVFRNGHACARYASPNPPRAFGPHATVVFGRRHPEAADPDRSFTGRIKDARIHDQALNREAIAGLVPGQADNAQRPWAWWSFADEGLRETTGRFDGIQLIGDVLIANGCLVLGGPGATVVTSASGGIEGESTPVPRA
jgi:hypothetical protein